MRRTACIYLGADHNGFGMKHGLAAWLLGRGFSVRDLSNRRKQATDDYPAYAAAVARAVARHRGSVGILLCGSGNGMAMAANRFRAIRAALCATPRAARKARTDEDANVLVLPSWWITERQARAITAVWLATRFSAQARHVRRIRQLTRLGRG